MFFIVQMALNNWHCYYKTLIIIFDIRKTSTLINFIDDIYQNHFLLYGLRTQNCEVNSKQTFYHLIAITSNLFQSLSTFTHADWIVSVWIAQFLNYNFGSKWNCEVMLLVLPPINIKAFKLFPACIKNEIIKHLVNGYSC